LNRILELSKSVILLSPRQFREPGGSKGKERSSIAEGLRVMKFSYTGFYSLLLLLLLLLLLFGMVYGGGKAGPKTSKKKSKQVQHMANNYQNAKLVLVFLVD
jgi:hypothetical protein